MNGTAESPFATLTCQMQGFGRLLGIHALDVGHSRFNGDFQRDHKNENKNGVFLQLLPNLHNSLLTFELCLVPEVKKAEQEALDTQQKLKIAIYYCHNSGVCKCSHIH